MSDKSSQKSSTPESSFLSSALFTVNKATPTNAGNDSLNSLNLEATASIGSPEVSTIEPPKPKVRKTAARKTRESIQIQIEDKIRKRLQNSIKVRRKSQIIKKL